MTKNKVKKYMSRYRTGFDINQVSAFINNIKYTFTGEGIFNSLGERLK